MIQLLLEDNDRFGQELTLEELESLTLWCLDYLYDSGLFSLKKFFERLTPSFGILLARVYESTKIRSNWHELFSYAPGLVPGSVMTAVQKDKMEEEQWKQINESLKHLETKEKKAEPAETPYQQMVADLFRRFQIWASGLEGTIDYLFAKVVRGEVQS